MPAILMVSVPYSFNVFLQSRPKYDIENMLFHFLCTSVPKSSLSEKLLVYCISLEHGIGSHEDKGCNGLYLLCTVHIYVATCVMVFFFDANEIPRATK
jgi:hypothetical protein